PGCIGLVGNVLVRTDDPGVQIADLMVAHLWKHGGTGDLRKPQKVPLDILQLYLVSVEFYLQVYASAAEQNPVQQIAQISCVVSMELSAVTDAGEKRFLCKKRIFIIARADRISQ